MVFDHDTMRWAAAWTGDKFIDWKGIAFDGSHGTHASIIGVKSFTNPNGPGWAIQRPAVLKIHGCEAETANLMGRCQEIGRISVDCHRKGDAAILAYSVGDAEILEQVGYEVSGSVAMFSRTFSIGKSSHNLLARISPESAPAALVGQSQAKIILENGLYLLQIPAASTPLKVKVMVGNPGPGVDPMVVYGFAVTSKPAVDLTTATNGFTPSWPSIQTHGKPGSDEGPFAVDEITLPTESQ
jgi:hypothetical protein